MFTEKNKIKKSWFWFRNVQHLTKIIKWMRTLLKFWVLLYSYKNECCYTESKLPLAQLRKIFGKSKKKKNCRKNLKVFGTSISSKNLQIICRLLLLLLLFFLKSEKKIKILEHINLQKMCRLYFSKIWRKFIKITLYSSAENMQIILFWNVKKKNYIIFICRICVDKKLCQIENLQILKKSANNSTAFNKIANYYK